LSWGAGVGWLELMTDNDFVKEAAKWQKLPTPAWFIGLKDID